VKTHLVQSILVTLCCCQILGVVAIIYSALAHAKNAEGDYDRARELASKANTWGLAGVVLGVIAGIIYAFVGFQTGEFVP
jgi:hypothetical protein